MSARIWPTTHPYTIISTDRGLIPLLSLRTQSLDLEDQPIQTSKSNYVCTCVPRQSKLLFIAFGERIPEKVGGAKIHFKTLLMLSQCGLHGRSPCGRGLYVTNLDQQDRCHLSRREIKDRLEPSPTRKCNTFIIQQPQLQLFREVKTIRRCVTDTIKIYRVSQLTVFKAQISGERRLISHQPGGVTSRWQSI